MVGWARSLSDQHLSKRMYGQEGSTLLFYPSSALGPAIVTGVSELVGWENDMHTPDRRENSLQSEGTGVQVRSETESSDTEASWCWEALLLGEGRAAQGNLSPQGSDGKNIAESLVLSYPGLQLFYYA